jgi:octaprenyl-diphosphate synthase
MPKGASAYDTYRQSLAPILAPFEEYFQSLRHSFDPEIREVIDAVLKHPGKRLRPCFVFACSGMGTANATPSDRALRMAAIVELVHLSTLIHDDILDGAQTRHGTRSHHTLYNPQISVLTGDALYAHANNLAAQEEDVAIGRALATAVCQTLQGEISQGLLAKKGVALSLDQYIAQLLGKTGRLFGLSCRLGGHLFAPQDMEVQDNLASYGEAFGIAYQLYDDAVDIWGSEADFKKTLGTDQLQRKQTLPWILLQSQIGSDALAPLWEDRQAALAAFTRHGIPAQATAVFADYISRARQSIRGLPQEALLSLPLDYVSSHWDNLPIGRLSVELSS